MSRYVSNSTTTLIDPSGLEEIITSVMNEGAVDAYETPQSSCCGQEKIKRDPDKGMGEDKYDVAAEPGGTVKGKERFVKELLEADLEAMMKAGGIFAYVADGIKQHRSTHGGVVSRVRILVSEKRSPHASTKNKDKTPPTIVVTWDPGTKPEDQDYFLGPAANFPKAQVPGDPNRLITPAGRRILILIHEYAHAMEGMSDPDATAFENIARKWLGLQLRTTYTFPNGRRVPVPDPDKWKYKEKFEGNMDEKGKIKNRLEAIEKYIEKQKQQNQ